MDPMGMTRWVLPTVVLTHFPCALCVPALKGLVSAQMKWNPFKKKQDEEPDFDPLSDLSLDTLKVGYILDYDLTSWKVTAHNRYDYEGDWTDEWELSSADEVRYLEREEDDDVSWVLYRKISLDAIEEDVPAHIIEHEDPPETVTCEGVQYEAESSDAGHFHRNGAEEGKPFVNWTYECENEKQVLLIEQWGESDFEASFGEVVEPYQFSNILPGV
jgi:hypothetical protein